MGVINGDGAPLPGEQMGLPTSGWYSTSYEGSPATGAMEAAPLATVTVTPTLQSSQIDPDRVTVSVGDTFSSSSDTVVIQSFLTPSHADTTGIGGGSYGSDHAAARS
jgi:hypothetical protein